MSYKKQAMCTLSLLLVFTLATTTTNADIPRPRGVSLDKTSLYYPRDDQSWVCLDGTKTIRFMQINDDYCDCQDGTDEPGTAACSQGRFHCANLGHRGLDIPSSRVNDGICDCCDGTDEYEPSEGICPNTCLELGRAEQEQRRSEVELHKRGANKRAEMVSKGKQLRAERETRRVELEHRRSEQEAIKTEKEEIKRTAEAAEGEALEVYKEQQRERDAAAAETAKLEEGSHEMRVEAEANFLRYDVNKDGFVEITELQVDMTLDRDRNGVVTVEEAKYFLDERDRIDLDAFITLSWPRIKTVQMLVQGLFKPPVVDGEEPDDREEAELINEEQQHQPLVQGTEEQEHGEDQHENVEPEDLEDDEDGYADEADVGVGTVTEEAVPVVDYDPETQRLVEVANEARRAYTDVERQIREIENEIKEINDQNAKDYGPHEEYAVMDGECYKFEDREYVYSLCPFDRAAQQQRSGGSETTLGRWDQWVGEGDNKYVKQKYSHGASCWNGPQRSALVHLRCALESKITAVSEPNRCEYFFEFETPAACDNNNLAEEEERLHDEL